MTPFPITINFSESRELDGSIDETETKENHLVSMIDTLWKGEEKNGRDSTL